MKKLLVYSIIGVSILFSLSSNTFAEDVGGWISDPNADAIQNNAQGTEFVWPPAPASTNPPSSNILGIDDAKLREWNVDMNTIPQVLISLINILLWVAGTIAIVAIIYYALQMQINSGITWDSSGVDKAKKWIRGAIIGFIIAILAWFIVVRFIEILTNLSA